MDIVCIAVEAERHAGYCKRPTTVFSGSAYNWKPETRTFSSSNEPVVWRPAFESEEAALDYVCINNLCYFHLENSGSRDR